METLNVHRREGAMLVELNRPEALNSWNKQFGVDLNATLEEAERDDSVRAVCITGAGRAFSSGADLKGGVVDLTAEGRPDLQAILKENYHPAIRRVRFLPKPVVAAVNGPAVGIGMSLALAADIVVAKESAYFLLSFVNIGLAPDGGSSLFVPERIGFARAMELAMLGERCPAPRAAEWGLINRAIPDEAFQTEVDTLVDKLASGATKSYAAVKRQANAWLFERIQGQLDLEADTQQEMVSTSDFVEGVTAFVEKRPASFRGA